MITNNDLLEPVKDFLELDTTAYDNLILSFIKGGMDNTLLVGISPPEDINTSYYNKYLTYIQLYVKILFDDDIDMKKYEVILIKTLKELEFSKYAP